MTDSLAHDRGLGRPLSLAGTWPIRFDLGAFIGTAVLPFALVVYLGLKGGGYDEVVRSEVGIAVWWIILVSAVTGLLPMRRLPRWAVGSLVALLAFGAWTAIGIGWSESAERSLAEATRVATLLGVFALSLALQGFGSLRRTLAAVAAAIVVIGLLALGSRLHPSWFPPNQTADFIGGAQSRLNWPLNYWNGLATLVVMGIPLLLALATSARSVLVRALSASSVPALTLTAFFTLSRGGAIELAIALVVLFALSSSRAGSLLTWLPSAAAGGLLVIAALQRNELTDGLSNQAALSQGNDMLALTLITCGAVGLLVAALNLAHRSGLAPSIAMPRSASRAALGLAAVSAVTLFLALGGPSGLRDGFDKFKAPTDTASSDVSRFESVNGSNRWQLWSSAIDANQSSPLIGIGPGTFEYWWAANGSGGGFVRDAHSLYLETYGELGIVGLAILAALLIATLAACIARWREAIGGDRKLMAGVLAAMAAFLAAAAIDWVWELTILPVAFFLLAAAGASGLRRPAGDRSPSPQPMSPRMRLVVAVTSIAALCAIAVPLASTQQLRASQEAFGDASLSTALGHAQDAESIQPFAASPPLQRAFVLEKDGQLGAARSAAREATRAEPTNWRTWFTLARIEAEMKNAPAALKAFRQAKALNPNALIFNRT